MAELRMKRIYDDVATADGYRVLVDRLWPRGISKEAAALDDWAKAVAPSHELRKAFHHEGLSYEEFSERYRAELADGGALAGFAAKLPDGPVTLLTATRDVEESAIPILIAALKKSG